MVDKKTRRVVVGENEERHIEDPPTSLKGLTPVQGVSYTVDPRQLPGREERVGARKKLAFR